MIRTNIEVQGHRSDKVCPSGQPGHQLTIVRQALVCSECGVAPITRYYLEVDQGDYDRVIKRLEGPVPVTNNNPPCEFT